jgi:hypothetical protein
VKRSKSYQIIMRFTFIAVYAVVHLLRSTFVDAFLSPQQPYMGSLHHQQSSSAIHLSTTIEEKVDPIQKTPPGAGWEPEWEGRTGLSESEFMQSDMSKPDRSGMWECPLTRWDSDGYVSFK